MHIAKQAKSTFICFSALGIAIGACLIIWPQISAETICVILGIFLLAIGVLRIVLYFNGTVFGIPLYADLAIGFLIAFIGVLLIIHPGEAAYLLPLIMGFFMIFDGAFKLQTAVDIKRAGVRSWWYLLILAILTAACGVFLVADPFTGVSALMIALGICLIIDGVQNICTLTYISRYIKKEMPIDTFYTFK